MTIDTDTLRDLASSAAKVAPGPWTPEGEWLNTVIRDASGRIVFVRHRLDGATHEVLARFAAACSPEVVQTLLLENARLRACALKYLDYLQVPDRERGLESDLLNPEMVGETLAGLTDTALAGD